MKIEIYVKENRIYIHSDKEIIYNFVIYGGDQLDRLYSDIGVSFVPSPDGRWMWHQPGRSLLDYDKIKIVVDYKELKEKEKKVEVDPYGEEIWEDENDKDYIHIEKSWKIEFKLKVDEIK